MDQHHNPWSLDLQYPSNVDQNNTSHIQQLQYQAQQMSEQFEVEMRNLRTSSEEQHRYFELMHQQQLDSIRKEVEERERKRELSFNQQLETIKEFYNTQLKDQKSFYESITERLTQRSDKMEFLITDLRQSLEIARQQQEQKEDNISSLKTQLKDMTSRGEELYERAETLNKDVDHLNFTCDTLRAENRMLTRQIQQVTQNREELVVTRADIENEKKTEN